MPVDKGTSEKFAKDANSIANSLAKRNKSLRVPGSVSRGARPVIPSTLGVGHERVTGTDEGGGAGISSPVSEPTAGTRTYHTPPRTLMSTDGVFTIEVRDLKTIDMEDANGNAVQFEFAQVT